MDKIISAQDFSAVWKIKTWYTDIPKENVVSVSQKQLYSLPPCGDQRCNAKYHKPQRLCWPAGISGRLFFVIAEHNHIHLTFPSDFL